MRQIKLAGYSMESKKLRYIIVAGALIAVGFISLFLTNINTSASTCTSLVLKSGSSGTCVATLQQKLNYFSCAAGPADGIFGSMTDGAVRRFQTANSLYVDGVVGSQTWNRLYSTAAMPCGSDNDAADRALCTNSTSKCILVHRVGNVNRLELYQNAVLVESVTVNTGMAGYRTRN
ncbi:MAG: peptidoglycan-binding protein, partial [bacterium]|nr:peptidoglycan-binding protein [bacterium]